MHPSESQPLKRYFPRFRILIIGRANAGKTTILQRVCQTRDNPEIYDSAGKKIDVSVLEASRERGLHDIENEMVFRTNPGFVFHDSRGFEAGGQSEFDEVKAFIASRSIRLAVKYRIHAIWYCIPMDEDGRSFTEAEVKFFSQCDTGSVPVIVLFTKFDALYDDVHAELMSKGISRSDAQALAPQHAREAFANGPQLTRLYSRKGNQHPPKCHICLPDMDKDDADCTPLIECTAETLDNETLKQLFVSTQRTSLEVCIRVAVHSALVPKAVSTQTVLSRIFGKFKDSEIVYALLACFPRNLEWLLLNEFEDGWDEWFNEFFNRRSYYRPEDKDMWSILHSPASGSSAFENIVQFGSAAIIILEHNFYLSDQRMRDLQEYVDLVHVSLQEYVASPNAAAVREALSSAIHAYQAHSRSISGLIHRSQKKEEFADAVVKVILQHRLPRP